MFAYCGNNPVIYNDPSGCRFAMHANFDGSFSEETAPIIDVTPSPEEVALDEMREKGLTFYKDAPLTQAGNGSSAFTFGYIFMGADGDETLLKHEYGHIVQSRELGVFGYTFFIVTPSVIGFGFDRLGLMPDNTYYSLPWEYKADEYGGASHNYQSWAKPISDAYWAYAKFISGLF